MSALRFRVPSSLGIDRPVKRAMCALAILDGMSRSEAREQLVTAARLWADAAEEMKIAADALATVPLDSN